VLYPCADQCAERYSAACSRRPISRVSSRSESVMVVSGPPDGFLLFASYPITRCRKRDGTAGRLRLRLLAGVSCAGAPRAPVGWVAFRSWAGRQRALSCPRAWCAQGAGRGIAGVCPGCSVRLAAREHASPRSWVRPDRAAEPDRTGARVRSCW